MKEVIPGYYLCKIGNGVAYYLVDKEEYDHTTAINKQYNGMHKLLTLIHLLTQQVYQNHFYKIEITTWESLPESYKMDALALNPSIRKEYGDKFEHTKYNAVGDLRHKIFTALEQSTGKLRQYKWRGQMAQDYSYVLEPITDSPKKAMSAFADTCGAMSSTGLEEHKDALALQKDLQDFASGRFAGSTHNTAEIDKGVLAGLQSQIDKSTQNQNNTMNFGNIPGLDISFGKLEKGLLAFTMNGEIAFKGKDGNYVYVQTEGTTKTMVEVGSLKFDMDFYVLPAREEELQPGDIILQDTALLVVDAKKNGDLGFINPLTGARTTKLMRNNILNMYFYKKVVSMFNMMGDGSKKGLGLGGMNPMTLALMSGQMGGGSGDMSKFLILSQLTQGGNEPNPMLMMMLMGNQEGSGGNSNELMQFMMMSQAFGGGKGFGSMFGAPAKAPKAAPKKVTKKVPAKKVTTTRIAKG